MRDLDHMVLGSCIATAAVFWIFIGQEVTKFDPQPNLTTHPIRVLFNVGTGLSFLMKPQYLEP